MQGKLFVVSACSGGGKTTLVSKTLEQLQTFYSIERVITYTTKKPRLGEKDAHDYFFISEEEFQKKIEQQFFVEWSKVYGSYYGTPASLFIDIDQGHSRILIVDIAGARSFKKHYNDAVLIWISGYSLEDLKKRLQHRNEDTQDQIMVRLQRAEEELMDADSLLFNYTIENIELTRSVRAFEDIIHQEIGGNFMFKKEVFKKNEIKS